MGCKSSKVDPTILTNDLVELLIANTNFNEDEVRNWHAGFIRDCPNGLLDKKKFKEVYRSLRAGGNVDKFCDLTFKAFDQDGSGKIDFYEFMLALAATQQGDTKDKLGAAFEIYDTNKNGYIDLKEMISIFTAVYDLNNVEDRKGDKHPKKKAQVIMDKIDKTGKKKISKSDFINACLEDPDLKSIFAPHA